MSRRSQSIVRDILRQEEAQGRTLFAKTGWAGQIGWWTGWVERSGEPIAFSLNIDMGSAEAAPKRIAIGKTMLSRLAVY
jgi:beta-lactamase class D